MEARRWSLTRLFEAENLPATFWLLLTGSFLNRLGAFVVPFLSIYLTQQRGIDAGDVGLVLSLYGLGGVAAGLAGGVLADRLGRRRTLLLALTLSAGAMLQLSTARSLGHVAASTLALGFFGELYRPAMQAMVADLLPDAPRRASAFGLMYWAENLGFALSAMIAGWMSRFGFSTLFFADAASTLAFAAVALLLLPETRPEALSEPDSGPLEAARSLSEPFRDRAFLAVGVANFLMALCFFQVTTSLPVAMTARGISPRDFGLLIALNGMLVVALQPAATSLVRRFRRSRALATGATLLALGFGSHAFASSPSGFAAGIVLWTAGELASASLVPAVIADLSSPQTRGCYQGALSFTHGAAAFLGPLLGGLLLSRAGHAALWFSCGAAGLAAAGAHLAAAPARARRMAVLGRAGD